MTVRVFRFSVVLAASLLFAGPLLAQTAPAPPPAAMRASRDPATAPPGVYNIDLEHSAVVARVSHMGFSYNVVRFGVASGRLDWDPARPESIALDVTVDAKPYHAPIVYRISPETILKTAEFPQARFVSTVVRPTGPNQADVEGQ